MIANHNFQLTCQTLFKCHLHLISSILEKIWRVGLLWSLSRKQIRLTCFGTDLTLTWVLVIIYSLGKLPITNLTESSIVIETTTRVIHYDSYWFLEECQLSAYLSTDLSTTSSKCSPNMTGLIFDEVIDRSTFLLVNVLHLRHRSMKYQEAPTFHLLTIDHLGVTHLQIKDVGTP